MQHHRYDYGNRDLIDFQTSDIWRDTAFDLGYTQTPSSTYYSRRAMAPDLNEALLDVIERLTDAIETIAQRGDREPYNKSSDKAPYKGPVDKGGINL